MNQSWTLTTAALAAAMAGLVPVAGAQALETSWVESYNSKVRLVAGKVEVAGKPRLFGGIHVKLAPGWKTYWRMPGDSGGVPPFFTWDKSDNLAAPTVLYPAPQRMTDPAGDAIGYKGDVLFPFEISALDASRPTKISLRLEYGICREICVPAEAVLEATIPPGASLGTSAGLTSAVASVPAPQSDRGAGGPALIAGETVTRGDKPSLAFTVAFPAGASATDLFVEAPDGIYLPLPARAEPDGAGRARFHVDLSSGVEIGELSGKALRLTMVSSKGNAEAEWKAP